MWFDIDQWSQSSGSNVIQRRARPGLAGLTEEEAERVGKQPHADQQAHLPTVQGYLADKKTQSSRTVP